ncbi:MAG: TlpA family protein disulfide reductase [Tannerellaceae bacterium]|jgi:peroxiredoxin|nr:TlpA family protein disulfide reductase [Tannerellaceae bacterium]
MDKYISLLFLAFVSVFLSCVKEGDDIPDEVISYVGVGDAVPAFTVADDKGGTFSSSGFVGKRSLLLLFVSSCGDCQKVLPVLNNAIWPWIKDNPGYQLITISRDETAQEVAGHWSDNNYTMPVYLDPGREVFSLFANSVVPRLYIINEEGIIEWMAVEKLEISSEQLIEIVVK